MQGAFKKRVELADKTIAISWSEDSIQLKRPYQWQSLLIVLACALP